MVRYVYAVKAETEDRRGVQKSTSGLHDIITFNTMNLGKHETGTTPDLEFCHFNIHPCDQKCRVKVKGFLTQILLIFKLVS